MRQRQTVDDEPWYLWPRLWTDAPLQANAAVPLPADQAHYLKNVLRLKEGDKVRLFHASAGEWDCHVATLTKRDVILQLDNQRREPAGTPRPLVLLFSLVKKEALDLILVKAVELGVTHLQPILTERTVVRGFNAGRAESVTREAAEQCERLTLPDIAEPLPLKQAVIAWAGKATLTAALEADETLPLLHTVGRTLATQPAGLIVGPEGGFTSAEQGWLAEQEGVLAVSLGPRIVKAETASLMGLALLGPDGGE